MSEPERSKRGELVREVLLFQLKLMVDGIRDLVLMPVSLIAAAFGLIRSEQNPDKEFNRVLEAGRQSEQWINLFGAHDPIAEAGDAGSIDRLVTRAETVVRQQVASGRVSDSAADAIGQVLAKLHDKAQGPADRP